MHEIRWNPLIKQWIIVASHREKRPWRPDEKEVKVKCPFCPGAPELQHLSRWDVVVLPNKYPALVPDPPYPLKDGFEEYLVREAFGYAEVIVETQSHEGDLCNLSLSHVVKVMEVYREESNRLSQTPGVQYVAVFRNKGKEIGVSLSHPHSQIYALPFIPPRIMTEITSLTEYRNRKNSCLICDIIRYESETSKRIVYRNKSFIALLPYYSMWPYEIHVYSVRHTKSIRELTSEELRDLADVVRVVTAIYNEWLGRDAPYIMALHDHPSKGNYEYHFHVEFYQPYRDKDKLKYAAGIEWGYWVFTYDGIPEERAFELKQVCRRAVEKIGETQGVCG